MSPRREQEPTVKVGGMAHVDENSKTYNHPAYAQIQANRTSGQTTLYDSDFVHQHYVTIRISASELNRDLAHDWHFPRQQYIEVAMSEAQWATFVSSMNTGGGTPCTLEYLGGAEIPSIPRRKQKSAFDAELKSRIDRSVDTVDKAIAAVEAEIGMSLSGKKKSSLLDILKRLRQNVADNIPWIAKSYAEHMERTTERAKVEVNAYATSLIQRAGLAAIAGNGPLQLTAGPDEGETYRQGNAGGRTVIEKKQPDGSWVEVTATDADEPPNSEYAYRVQHVRDGKSD